MRPGLKEDDHGLVQKLRDLDKYLTSHLAQCRSWNDLEMTFQIAACL